MHTDSERLPDRKNRAYQFVTDVNQLKLSFSPSSSVFICVYLWLN
jgi:hypothetical protein